MKKFISFLILILVLLQIISCDRTQATNQTEKSDATTAQSEQTSNITQTSENLYTTSINSEIKSTNTNTENITITTTTENTTAAAAISTLETSTAEQSTSPSTTETKSISVPIFDPMSIYYDGETEDFTNLNEVQKVRLFNLCEQANITVTYNTNGSVDFEINNDMYRKVIEYGNENFYRTGKEEIKKGTIFTQKTDKSWQVVYINENNIVSKTIITYTEPEINGTFLLPNEKFEIKSFNLHTIENLEKEILYQSYYMILSNNTDINEFKLYVENLIESENFTPFNEIIAYPSTVTYAKDQHNSINGEYFNFYGIYSENFAINLTFASDYTIKLELLFY